MNDNIGNDQFSEKDVLIADNLTGIVIKYISEKGFGFIQVMNSDMPDVFVYHNQIKNIDRNKEFVKLQIGQDVTFDLFSTPRGYVAKNVHIQGMNQDFAVNSAKKKVL